VGSALVAVAHAAATITVDPDSATLSRFGQSFKLTATAHDGGGVLITDKAFAWALSDETVVEVNSPGFVTCGGEWHRDRTELPGVR
jgi:uncharacterized protein YjdB